MEELRAQAQGTRNFQGRELWNRRTEDGMENGPIKQQMRIYSNKTMGLSRNSNFGRAKYSANTVEDGLPVKCGQSIRLLVPRPGPRPRSAPHNGPSHRPSTSLYPREWRPDLDILRVEFVAIIEIVSGSPVD